MKNQNFNKDWWFKFLEKNRSFTETTVFKDVISENLLEELNKGVLELLKMRFNRNDIHYGFRVYVDGQELTDNQISALIENNKIGEEESIEGYCNRVFGNNYGIIANFCEKYSEILAEKIMKTVHPLFDVIGMPPWGVELTTFIGNYGWTPLGIHVDSRGENVLHYHLGPGNKKMYIWDEDTYQVVGKGVENNKIIEPLLKYAEEFEFGTGDLYYMPWNKRHVGYSGEFSIGVSLWFNNPTRLGFSAEMIKAIQNLFIKNDQSIIEAQLDYENNDSTFLDFKSTLNISENKLQEPLENFLKDTYDEYKKCILSNGGWQNVPLSLHKKLDDKEEYFPDLENQTVYVDDLFRIKYQKVDEKLCLYVRGKKLSFKYFEELEGILERINEAKRVDVQTIINEFDTLPKEVVLYFLKILINNKGVKIESLEAVH